MKLRLYHHHDGARVAYREAGTGRALALLHSKLLSHREWEPVVEELSHRYRSSTRRAAHARWSVATRSARRSCCTRSPTAASSRGDSC